MASIEDAACIRDPASIGSFTGRYIMRCRSGLRPRLAYVAPQIAVHEGAASQQGRGWKQKGGEIGNWKMLAPPHDNSNLILHKSR